MSKRVNNRVGNRLRKTVARRPAHEQPRRVRAASSYRFSILGAHDAWSRLLSRMEMAFAPGWEKRV